MTDINRLEDIVRSLRDNAQKFSAAATHLQQQTQRLDWSADDLASSSATWAGQGSQAFQIAWQVYHDYTLKSKKWLSGTADAMNKLAQDIDDQVQQIQEAQLEVATITLITIGLGVLDVAQLGLDPITDAATAGSGGVDSAAINQVEAATAAIVEVDIQAGTELDEIASQIETTTDLPNMNSIDGELGGTDMNIGGSSSDNPSSTVEGIGNQQDSFFPNTMTYKYDPVSSLIKQEDERSCGAACMRMVLQEDNINVTEAQAAAEGEMNPEDGMDPYKLPNALNRLSNKPDYYKLTRSYSITDAVDKAKGQPIITGVYNENVGAGHGIVVDGIDGDMVEIRDPAGSAYKVPINIFNQVWDHWIIKH